jgi:uncharacterized protein YndB with AHSA1/START domain
LAERPTTDPSNAENSAGGGDVGETFDVVVSRIFPVPPDQAWRAWSESELVKQWWGPTGFSCPLADVDLRVGGRTLVAMRAPAEFGGGDMYSTWTYSEVVPHSRIEYVFNFADPQGNRLVPADLGMPPGVPDDGEHLVTFDDLGDGRTEMTIIEHGYTTEDARNLSQAGLEQCVDKMEAIFAGPGT